MVRTKHPVRTLEDFCSQLRRHGLKATRQRQAVHQVMMELEHASADMVREHLAQNGVAVTTASVYNILSQLADYHIYVGYRPPTRCSSTWTPPGTFTCTTAKGTSSTTWWPMNWLSW